MEVKLTQGLDIAGGYVPMIFPKIGWGVQSFSSKFEGDHTLLCFIAFLLSSFLKIQWGGVFCHTPSVPVCIYEQAHVSKLCLNILRERERDCMIRMKRCQKMVYILQKKPTYARFCFFAR